MPARREPLTEISENDAMSSPNANTTGSVRRKSGRAVRVPEKFQPAPTTQSENTNGKRKRGGANVDEDEENDVDEQEEESEEDEEEEESEEEEETKATRRKAKTSKKPVAKKAKVNGTASDDDAPALKLPNRPKKSKKVAIVDESAEGLYGELCTHSLQHVGSNFWCS
jgi:cohesin complex subunit SA-1/2